MPLLPGATGSPAGEGAALGGTNGGLIGAGGAGKSTTEERDLVEAAFFAEVGFTGASAFADSATTVFVAGALATVSSGFAGGVAFFTGVSATAFLSGGAFFAGAGDLTGVTAVSSLTAGVFFAATGFEDSTAGFAFPLSGAGVEVVFFAAMASS